MRRAVITGLGPVTPAGTGKRALWQSIVEHRSGIGPLTRLDALPYRARHAAEIRDFVPEGHFTVRKLKRLDRFAQFSILASRLALEDSGLDLGEAGAPPPERIGCSFGTALGGFCQAENEHTLYLEKGPRAVSRSLAFQVFAATAHTNVALELGLEGAGTTNANSCAAGNTALIDAARFIRDDEADVVIAGGAEAPLSPMAFAAFDNLKTMSEYRGDEPALACRPFDVARDGFVMGEGATAFVVEEFEHARKRGAHIYGEILGGSITTEAYHMTTPDPSGKTLRRAINLALERAGLNPEDIDHINAHGSATAYNDINEGLAIQTIYGHYSLTGGPSVTATKAYTGHPLGAAGAFEAALCLLAMDYGVAPAILNLEEPIPELDLDLVSRECREQRIARTANHSFGFGGINSVVIFGRV